ncbi:MAG: PaaI family thioesterase [Candidatus Promineifilaceae bacterium]|nr:PaaI family thioesterase [Candidatus Promineifilaceae bacterium]
MSQEKAFQDLMPGNHCFGCGPKNEGGLQIKSYWTGQDKSICHFWPSAHHSAGPENYLNGGIMATIIDCHTVCTAVAKAYELEGRRIGEGDLIWYVTGDLQVSYKKPVAIDSEVTLRARVEEVREKKSIVSCSLWSRDLECAAARVVAVRVPLAWLGK